MVPIAVKAAFPLSEPIWDRLEAYVVLLQRWNKTYRLVGSAAPEVVWDLHIADSLLLLPFVPACGCLLDLGSGAGLPGIPIQIVRQELEVVLVEPQQKRVNFCEEVKRCLGLSKLRIIRGRAEDIEVVEQVGGADLIVSRATWQLAAFVQQAMAYRAASGRIIAMKGPGWKMELEDLKVQSSSEVWAQASIHQRKLPLSRAERALLIF